MLGVFIVAFVMLNIAQDALLQRFLFLKRAPSPPVWRRIFSRDYLNEHREFLRPMWAERSTDAELEGIRRRVRLWTYVLAVDIALGIALGMYRFLVGTR